MSNSEKTTAVQGMNVNDARATEILGTEMNHEYPIADTLNGVFTGEICADDQDGYAVDPSGMYAIPLTAAIRAGYDAENQSW